MRRNFLINICTSKKIYIRMDLKEPNWPEIHELLMAESLCQLTHGDVKSLDYHFLQLLATERRTDKIIRRRITFLLQN